MNLERMPARGRQRGAILIVSLLLLLVMTILAVTAMRASTFQERMAGNARDMNLAFQSSEAAARAAESWVLSRVEQPFTCGDLATCDLAEEVLELNVLPDDLRSQDADWWTGNTVEYGDGDEPIDLVREQPRFVVEELGFVEDDLATGLGPPEGRAVYRVYARAEGGTASAQSVVETTVTRRF